MRTRRSVVGLAGARGRGFLGFPMPTTSACAAVLLVFLGQTLASGTITTVAGTGAAGYGGDGGPATRARLHGPRDAFAAQGSIYIADTFNNRIRRINPSGSITTVAGTGAAGYGGDGGPATKARLHYPHEVVADGAGNLYIADSANHRIRMVKPSGVIVTIAGTGASGFGGDGGPATRAKLRNPKGVVFHDGRLYIADGLNHRIRMVNARGIITTVAGTGVAGYGGDGGPATRARLHKPQRMAFDAAGNLYIADGLNHRIRKVDPRSIITTVAGTGVAGYNGDGGPATRARLNTPRGVLVDFAGRLFIADSQNHRIRRVDLRGIITTVAGTGVAGYSGDGRPATQARLKNPRGMALDAKGNLLVADTFNNRIRLIAR